MQQQEITATNQLTIPRPSKQLIKISQKLIQVSPVLYRPRILQQSTKDRAPKQQKSQKHPSPNPPQHEENKNWNTYLRECYQHYCKATYLTGRHSTFQQIQSKATTMTIRAFVNFCRDFGIQIDLIKLVEVFKKVTGFSLTMTYEQFVQAIFSISDMLFPPPIEEQNQESNEFMDSGIDRKQPLKKQHKVIKIPSDPPQEFSKMLKMLNMDNPAAFRDKKIKLDMRDRKHGLNPYENLIKLKPTSDYKFKLAAMNGKNEDDMKEELQYRKNIKSNTKQKVKELKEMMSKKQAKKFAQLNKISISQKKIAKGGYISPPLLENKDKDTTSKLIISKLASSKVSSIMVGPISQINTQKIVEPRRNGANQQRHHTQFNTYSNSLESSMFLQIADQETVMNQEQGYGKKLKKGPKIPNSYLNTHKRYKNIYQINPVIRQAKQQSKLSNHTHIPTRRVQRVETEPFPDEWQKINLEYMVGDLTEEDEYLQRLSKGARGKAVGKGQRWET